MGSTRPEQAGRRDGDAPPLLTPHVYSPLPQKPPFTMGVQGGNAPLKIQLSLKTYSPSRASEGTAFTVVWAREGGERAPVALCREPVSAPASGPAPRWGASRTDRSGSGDRFAAAETRGWA